MLLHHLKQFHILVILNRDTYGGEYVHTRIPYICSMRGYKNWETTPKEPVSQLS